MPHIESPRHRVLEPLHALHQIRLGRLNEKMVMIVHQHPRVNKPTRFFTDISQTLQKKPPVVVIHKDRTPPVPPSHHMIKSSFKFQSNTSCHDGNSTDKTNASNKNLKDNEP
jgi:hypothetical protein